MASFKYYAWVRIYGMFGAPEARARRVHSTSPYYRQSNGTIERWHRSLKSECIWPSTPLSLEIAGRLVESYGEHHGRGLCTTNPSDLVV